MGGRHAVLCSMSLPSCVHNNHSADFCGGDAVLMVRFLPSRKSGHSLCLHCTREVGPMTMCDPALFHRQAGLRGPALRSRAMRTACKPGRCVTAVGGFADPGLRLHSCHRIFRPHRGVTGQPGEAVRQRQGPKRDFHYLRPAPLLRSSGCSTGSRGALELAPCLQGRIHTIKHTTCRCHTASLRPPRAAQPSPAPALRSAACWGQPT